MAGRDPLNSIADVAALEAEADKVIALIRGIDTAVKSVSEIKSIYKDSKGSADQKKISDELAAANKKVKDAQAELNEQTQKAANLQGELAKQIAITREQNNARRKELAAEAREAAGLNDAYKKLELQYAAAAREAKNLAVTQGANSKEAQEAAAKANDLNNQLKQIDATVGQFQRNVGNYSGALKTLEKSLNDVKNKIDDHTKSGKQNDDVLKALVKEQQLLESLVDVQSKGFANATSEIKKNQQAIMLLTQLYGEDSAVVKKLVAETAELTDTVGDMRATIKAQASDTHVFDGLIGAATGLMGIYTVAQGAAQLFGDENEELQKTFVKLQAAMAVLQGLQAIQNVLQKESAARQLINIGLQKITTVQTNLQAAAESRNIVVRYAAIAAQKALNLVMSAAGGPLLAIIGLIALMVLSLKSMAAETENAGKSLGRLSAEFERDLKVLEDYSASVKRNGDEIIASMEAQFASESEVRKQRAQNLREQLQAALDLEAQYGQSVEIQRQKLIKTLKKNAADLTEEEKKRIEEQDQLIQKYEAQKNKRADLASQLRVLLIDNEKATKAESIKARQDDIEALKAYLQSKASAQNNIVSNDRKSYDERIAAAQEFQKLQEQIINNDTKKQLLTPGLTPSQIKVIETQRKSAVIQARTDGQRQIDELNRQAADRERKAQYEIARTGVEARANGLQEIASDENKSLIVRLEASAEYQKSQESLINAQRDLELANTTLTSTERTAIETKADADILQSRIALQKQIKDITIAEMDEEARNRVLANDKQRDEAITALNEQYQAGKISLAEYNAQRLQLEKKYSIESLQIQIDNTKKLIEEYKILGINTAEQEAKLAELQKNLSDEVTQKRIDNIEKIKAKEKEIADAVVNLIGTLVSAGYDQELNAIQNQIEASDKLKSQEEDRINSSTLSEQEKHARLAQLDIQAQTRKDQLEAKAKDVQLKQAKFDRDKAVASVIWDTAKAIMKDTAGVPWPASLGVAAADAALGAVQVATILARPLPKYATGTDNSPEGFAIVGELGHELRKDPDGNISLTPAVPTLTYLQQGTQIIPHDEVNKMMLQAMMQNTVKMPEREDMAAKKIDRLTQIIQWQHSELISAWARIAKQNRTIIPPNYKDFGRDYIP
jgi:hypothetical protein